MGSELSKAAASVNSWIASKVIAVGTAIWYAASWLFTKIWDGFKWLASWLGFYTKPPSPTGPTPPSPPTAAITPPAAQATVQQKEEEVKKVRQAKDLMKDMMEYLQDIEDIKREDIATGDTPETERKLREVQQKAERKNIAGRVNSLMNTVPPALT